MPEILKLLLALAISIVVFNIITKVEVGLAKEIVVYSEEE